MNPRYVTHGLVLLICDKGHEHQVAPEQALRLYADPCGLRCQAPIVYVNVAHIVPSEREQLRRGLGLEPELGLLWPLTPPAVASVGPLVGDVALQDAEADLGHPAECGVSVFEGPRELPEGESRYATVDGG